MSNESVQPQHKTPQDVAKQMLLALHAYDGIVTKLKESTNDKNRQRKLHDIESRLSALHAYFTAKVSTTLPAVESADSAATSSPKTIQDLKAAASRAAEPISKTAELVAVLRDVHLLFDEDQATITSYTKIEEVLLTATDLIASRPEKLIAAMFDHIAEMELSPSEADISGAREAFINYDDTQRREALHIAEMLTSEDVVGVILRGHIILEKALRKCVDAFLPIERHQLWGRSGLTFERTVKLGFALGLVTSDESALLIYINTLRNKLAHTDNTISTSVGAGIRWTQFGRVKTNPPEGRFSV